MTPWTLPWTPGRNRPARPGTRLPAPMSPHFPPPTRSRDHQFISPASVCSVVGPKALVIFVSLVVQSSLRPVSLTRTSTRHGRHGPRVVDAHPRRLYPWCPEGSGSPTLWALLPAMSVRRSAPEPSLRTALPFSAPLRLCAGHLFFSFVGLQRLIWGDARPADSNGIPLAHTRISVKPTVVTLGHATFSSQ